jgi:putative ATP-dependent endonuclease of OLD family
LGNLLILTNDGTSATAAVSPGAQISLEPVEKADIERYIDATRASLLFARRVLLVEGPAELFLVAPLAKVVLGVDLDSKGISVIPIYGRHFASYAKLFGADAITKRCAILADGDRPDDLPDDAEIDEAADNDLTVLENDFVKAFVCRTTFEKELVGRGRLVMLINALQEVGSPGRAAKLRAVIQKLKNGEVVDWPAAQQVSS